jgi:NADH dehydrogenase [ubiquinone] 1 alpha subcomplex assembly factor 6
MIGWELHNISQENVMRGQLEGMEDAVFEVATAAYDQLLTARSLLDTVTPEAFPVILSSVRRRNHTDDDHFHHGII